MIVIKKSHDDIGEDGDIANIAIIASANFYISPVGIPVYRYAAITYHIASAR